MLNLDSVPATPARLLRLLERAKAFIAAMSPDEREAYFTAQRRRAVLAEIACGNEDATVATC